MESTTTNDDDDYDDECIVGAVIDEPTEGR